MNRAWWGSGPTPAPPRSRWVTWLGLAVVLIAAAVLSFDALRGLALAVSIPERFAWLLPIAIDAGAAVSCATWLSPTVPADASRFAAGMTWALLAVTVVGNAGQLGMHAEGIVPPWQVAVAVGALPPAVVGSVVHLMVLIGRTAVSRPDQGSAGADGTQQSLGDDPILDTPADREIEPQDQVDPLLPDVRDWIDRQGGTPSQRQLRTEFSIGAERARKLLEAA